MQTLSLESLLELLTDLGDQLFLIIVWFIENFVRTPFFRLIGVHWSVIPPDTRTFLSILLLGVNLISGILLAPYAFNYFFLSLIAENWKAPPKPEDFSSFPRVTVQVPTYNESLVIHRIIDHVCALDYPTNLLDIQILDDSTDRTTQIAREVVKKYAAQEIDIELIHRDNRIGFKAGALVNGMKTSKGEFIAIFDADFMPEPDFLKRMVPYFYIKGKVGAVQARWAHQNRNWSYITRAFAIGLDGHFFLEQMGRKAANCFLTFNGTAGIWRRECIEDAGGWSHDTLVEDLDLSYRAQMRGWEIVFLKDVLVPQEIPITMPSIKVQQRRWSTGGMQCFRKTFLTMLRCKTMSLKAKIESSLHLSAYLIYPTLIINMLSACMLIILGLEIFVATPVFFTVYSFLTIASVVAYLAYIIMLRREKFSLKKEGKYIIVLGLLGFGMTLSLAFASIKGFFQKGGTFERTPKFDAMSAKETKQKEESVPSSKELASPIQSTPSKKGPTFPYRIKVGFGKVIFELLFVALILTTVVKAMQNLQYTFFTILFFLIFSTGIFLYIYSMLRGMRSIKRYYSVEAS
ncbi:MAG: glycosyltransferase [Promethearchaeota archaeon]